MSLRPSLTGLLAVAILAAVPAFAQDVKAGTLTVRNAWTRPAAAGFNGAGYMSITNTGKTADTLLGAETAQAGSISLHQSVMTGDIASMKSLPQGVVIPPGQTLALSPGGYHFMLLGLKQAQASGGRLPVTLKFAKAGRVTVNLAVLVASPPAPGGAHKH